jgi:hypothetical protein
MTEPHVYVRTAAALGPCGDTTRAERRVLAEDPAPLDFKELVKRVVGVPLRQASHLVELAAIGSQLCLKRLGAPAPEDTAVYVGTGLGEVRKTNALFYQVMPPGPGLASPFDFINAANNMAAFYAAKLGSFRARNLTITQEEFSFEWALKLAVDDLREGRFRQALVGGMDEHAPPRLNHTRRIALAPDQILGEGGGWLFLTNAAERAIGEIVAVEGLPAGRTPVEVLAARLATWRQGSEPVVLLPGFRVQQHQLAALREAFPDFVVENYLDWCGCFHTAAAFGLGAMLDTPSPTARLYVHVNRRPAGHWMLIAARAYPAPGST